MTLLKKLNNKRGFTLAELMIVVAIIGVLAAIAFVFVNPNDISYVEYNRSAEAIATAVQNRLTEIKNTGDMAKLRGLGDPKEVKDPPADNKGGYRYVFSYIEEDGEIVVNPDISYLLPFGAIDYELTQNYYVVGFQSDTGMVGEVFYSTKPFEQRTVGYLTGLDGTARKSANIGYYRGDTNDTEIAFANLPTPQLTITNFEELTLRIYVPAVKQLQDYGKELGIIVSLYDEDGEAQKANLNVMQTSIYSTFRFDDSASTGSIVKQKLESGTTYTIVLDTVKQCHPKDMERLLSDSEPPTGVFEDWAVRSKAYKDGYYEIGDNADLVVTVYCLYSDPEDSNFPVDPTFMPRSASLNFNGWFNKYGNSTADIACGRHLQNLGKLTKLNANLEKYLPKVESYKDEEGNIVYSYGDYNYGMASTFTDGSSNASPSVSYDDVTEKYKYRKDITVKKITKANQVNAIDFNNDAWRENDGTKIAFKSLNLPPNFTYYGHYLTIKNIYVDEPFYAGLIGYAYHAKLYDILLVNPTITSQMPAHLAEIYEMGVGGLIGTSRHSSEINNCQIYMTQENDGYNTDYRVTGECYVGGLIGFCEDEDISHCSASVYTGYKKDATKSVVTTPNAEGEGAVTVTTKPVSSKYVGGLIGCITGDSNISDCYAAGNLSGDYVGGLIGFIVEDSNPAGDDYRIETCYTAGHIEYASREASGILGYVSEFAGNVKSALSIYKNYCVVIYGTKDASGNYKWDCKDKDGNPVPIYGTFKGDGFEWLHTSTSGFSDFYLTGTYAGTTLFAGTIFDSDNRNYYIAQKNIPYSNSPYYTAMTSIAQQILADIKGAKTTETLKTAINTALEKLEWLKKRQALEDLKLTIENIIYEVESETGTYKDKDGNICNYRDGGYYQYTKNIYLDTSRARIEGKNNESGHTYSESITVVQALHIMYDGTYTDATGAEKTVKMSYGGSDNDKKKLNNFKISGSSTTGVYTFMDYYNFLKEQYDTLLSDTATDSQKATAKSNLIDIVGENNVETYTTQDKDGKIDTHNFYEKGLLYAHFYSDLLIRVLDKAKDYFQYDLGDKTGELIFRHFRDLGYKFRNLICDLGISPEGRATFLKRTKLAALDEAITTLTKFTKISEQWTSENGTRVSATDKTAADNYAAQAKTALEALRKVVNDENVTQKQLEDYIKATQDPLDELYAILDKYKVPDTLENGKEKKDYYEVVDVVVDTAGKTTEVTKDDMRKLRDPISIYRRSAALCAATSGSGIESALNHLAMDLNAATPDINTLVTAFENEVNIYLGQIRGSYADSGQRVKNSEEMCNVIRGVNLYGESSERQPSLGFMYDYGNESDTSKLENPYKNKLANGSYVYKDNNVYNNVFPYIENSYTSYYPFPFVFGMALETDSSVRVSYILFHYGDWLTDDLWADDTDVALSNVENQMDIMSSYLTAIGNKDTTGHFQNHINALTNAITELKATIAAASAKEDSAAKKTALEGIRGTINGWLNNNGQIYVLKDACLKVNGNNAKKQVADELYAMLDESEAELKALIVEIDAIVGKKA